MGFLAGFTGGVTLTLSLTYLALHTHHLNREAQAAVLRSQISSIDALIPPPSDSKLPPSARRRNATVPLPDGTYRPRDSLEHYRPEAVAAAAPPYPNHPHPHYPAPRTSLIESAKQKWNAEILSAVHWAQTKDWARVRENAETSLARLLGIELSREPVPVERQPRHHDPLGFTSRKQVGVQQQKEDATVPPPEPPAHTRPGRITSALHRTRDTTLAMAHAMRDEAKEIVAEAKEVADEAVHEAKDAILAHRKAKSTSSSSDSSGGHNKKEIAKEKAHELAEKAKAAVHLVEEKAEAKLEAKLTGVSEVEKALAERFDSARREEKLNKSVPETLAERYIPMDQGKGEKNKDWRLL